MSHVSWSARRRTAALLVGVFAVGLVTIRSQEPAPPAQAPYVPAEVLVKFQPQASTARRNAALARLSGRLIRRFDYVDLHHIGLPPGQSVEAAVTALLSSPDVLYAQPNYLRHIVATAPPNDPYWLNDGLWGLRKIQAQAAWTNFGAGNGSVVVADIDTGVNYNHPDLSANMWRNPGEIPGNGIDDDGNGYVDDVFGIDTVNHDSDPMDDHGHGTHTAGTFGAVGNNGVGVAGVNWNVKILACKFIAANGSGSDADAVGCFNYIAALRRKGVNIRVSSNSWGGPGGGNATVLKNAIDAAGTAGILNVFAAGNSGANIDVSPFEPASFTSSSIVTVTASDGADNLFGNYGPTSVDLAAPGVSILSTFGNGYAYLDGTSMATPHVAGAAALLWSINPGMTVDAVKSALLNSVDRLAPWSTLVASGGRLNVFGAALAAAPNAPPTVALTAPAEGATYLQPAAIALTATASDSDGTVGMVTFYADGTVIGSDDTAPYSASWANPPLGTHTLTAAAIDNGGATTTSAAVHVTVQPASSALPSPWANQDVGTAAALGSTTYSGATFTVKGSGADIWGTADAFQFVYQPLVGDGQIIARLATQQNTHPWAKAGVMIREDLTATARHAALLVSPLSGLAYEARTQGAGATNYLPASGSAPEWLRLVRSGSTFTSYLSSDGVTWTPVGTYTIPLSTTAYVGLAVTSHVDGVLCTTTFDNVTVTAAGSANQPPVVALTSPTEGAVYVAPPTITLTANASDTDGTVTTVAFYADGTLVASDNTAPYSVAWTNPAAGSHTLTAVATDNSGATMTSAAVHVTVQAGSSGLPSPWANQDVGTAAAVGSATSAGATFTVKGSGADIWDPADAFQFVYQPLVGDGQIIARLATQQTTHPWAKAGVMIREDLTATARHAALLVSPLNGLAYEARTQGGGATNYIPASGSAPTWLRLVRSGSTFTSYLSSDGVTWTAVGTYTIPLGTTAYVGLAVTSHSDGVLCTATFDNVTVTAAGSANQPPAVGLTSPTEGAVYVAPPTITLTANASDTDGTVTTVAFYADGTLVASDDTAPYSVAWTNPAVGSHTLTAVATDNGGVSTTSAAVHVTVQPGSGALPGPWANQDVGTVAAVGSTTYSGATFTLKGSGADIWDTSDAFQFVYQPLVGDGQIIARLATQQNTHPWAKAGVMIREDLATSARHAALLVSPLNGLAYEGRAQPGAATNYLPGSGGAPKWLKLVRSGSTLSAYQSADGSNWIALGTYAISFGTTTYIGLAVTSHSDGVLCTATFDSVTVTAAGQ